MTNAIKQLTNLALLLLLSISMIDLRTALDGACWRMAFLGALFLCLLAAPLPAQLVFSNATDILSVHESGRVAHLQLTPAEYDRWLLTTQTYSDRTSLTARVYTHFQDVFDYIFVINDSDTLQGATYGTHWGIRNNVSGIGKSLFDSSTSYGSSHVIQSLVHLTLRTGLSGGPSLHEMSHRWANTLASIPTAVAGHWGYSSAGGQLGGWKHGTLTNLGGGMYDADGPSGGSSWGVNANGGNGIPYSGIELYLMGLIPAAQVTNDILIAQGFAWTNQSLGQFTASNITTVTISNVVATDGARLPAFGSAQTNFRALTLVISAAPMAPAQWQGFAQDVAAFCTNGDNGSSLYNFWEATGGRATMQMDGLLPLLKTGHEYLIIQETNTLSAAGIRGEAPTPSNFVYTLTNTFATPMAWTAQVSATWLSLSPTGGTLPAGSSIQVTAAFTPQALQLPGGNHTAELRFINTANCATVLRQAALTLAAFSELPFADSFESGTAAPFWLMSGTAEYRTQASTNWFPHAGNWHLCMDDSLSGGQFSRNECTLGLDLDGYTNVVLTFWAKSYGDESDGPPASPFTQGADFDGVAISANGTNWYEVQSLRSMATTNYTQFIVNLDTATASRGLTYNNRFRVRFNHYDNFSINAVMGSSDGITLDDISVTGSLLDSDADGMPDRFERANGFSSTNSADANADLDGDTLSNYGEYIADTSPTNRLSLLMITNLSQTAGASITFHSSSRRWYSLVFLDQLQSGTWQGVTGMTNQPGIDGPMTLTDPDANTRTSRFYQIQVTLP